MASSLTCLVQLKDGIIVLEKFSIGPNGERLCTYGDPPYPLRWYLQGPFRGAQTTPDQNE